MKYLATLCLIIVLLSSCEDSTTNFSIEHNKKENLTQKGLQPKIDVCHYSTEDDVWNMIKINANAWPAHKKHGDIRLDDEDDDGYVPKNNCNFGDMGDCDDSNPIVNPDGELEVTLSDGSKIYVYPEDNSSGIIWSPDGSISGANDYFDGLVNTNAIVRHYDEKGVDRTIYAAGICASLGDGCTWYLPAPSELQSMYEQLGPTANGFGGIGEITDGVYWSSSEFSIGQASVIIFSNGNPGSVGRTLDFPKCRCIRR